MSERVFPLKYECACNANDLSLHYVDFIVYMLELEHPYNLFYLWSFLLSGRILDVWINMNIVKYPYPQPITLTCFGFSYNYREVPLSLRLREKGVHCTS
jgi:hypothetical protein